MRSLPSKSFRDSPANARACASDDSGFTVKCEHERKLADGARGQGISIRRRPVACRPEPQSSVETPTPLERLVLPGVEPGPEIWVKREFRINIPERPGAMLGLLDSCFEGLNIADLQYGLHHVDEAWSIFTITAEESGHLALLPARLDADGYRWEDLSGAVDVAFRAIPLRGDLMKHPVFLRLDSYERAGALHDLLPRLIHDSASLCYFNYRQSGERIGRALIGPDFSSEAERNTLLAHLPEHGEGYR